MENKRIYANGKFSWLMLGMLFGIPLVFYTIAWNTYNSETTNKVLVSKGFEFYLIVILATIVLIGGIFTLIFLIKNYIGIDGEKLYFNRYKKIVNLKQVDKVYWEKSIKVRYHASLNGSSDNHGHKKEFEEKLEITNQFGDKLHFENLAFVTEKNKKYLLEHILNYTNIEYRTIIDDEKLKIYTDETVTLSNKHK